MIPADLPAPYAGPPLRIAYVGNFRHPWCTEVAVAGSLESLGHTVLRWQEDECDWSFVPSNAYRLGAQLLLWTRTWPAEMTIVEPMLKELAAEGIPTVSYHLDRWFGLDRAHQVDDQPFFRTSLVVSPDDSPLWAEHGVNHFWLPPGVFGPECEPVPPNPRRWPYDVVFVGSHPYPHPEWAKYRSDLLSAFSKAFRGRFGILPRRGTPIRGRDLQELYATVPVVLGDSCLAGQSFGYVSDRCPESIGRGAFLIHPYVRGMVEDHPDAWYQHGKDIAGYSLGNFGEAVDIARAALVIDEDRRRIAAHGRATVLARDTYAHRMGTVLAVAEGIHGGYRDVAPKGATAGLLSGFAGLVDHHKRHVGPPPIDYPALAQRSVHLHDWSAIFHPRPGTTDAEVISEVWGTNDYRVPSEGFKGRVLDIGSNVGAFAVLAATAGAEAVYAVEPDPDNRTRLVHHLTVNGVADRVRVLGCAVSGRADGRGRMVGTGGGARWEFEEGPEGVPCTTLEYLIDQLGPFEFVKVDCEGCCYSVFEACPVESLKGIDRIALEFHGPAMPHLTHLDDDGKHLERWGALVAKLADAGRVETFGHPMRGGLIYWRRY